MRAEILSALLMIVGLGCGEATPAPLTPADSGRPDAGDREGEVFADAAATDAGSPAPDAALPGPDATPSTLDDASTAPDAADPTIPLDQRTRAAQATADQHPLCTAISPFYWEIGDVSGPLAHGQRGTAFTATTTMPLASASKWMFGAYAVERSRDDLAGLDVRALTMLSGYTAFDDCDRTQTVAECQADGANGRYVAAHLDRYAYGGGHFQKYAVDLGLGPLDNAGLAAEYQSVLGRELPIEFINPQPAGGQRGSAADYALFLRKILGGGLAIRDHLGESPSCTLPGASCPSALRSPSDEAMHYGYGHWVEDAPGVGDGAFSSAGAFGFYPWIDASKTLYGIVARRAFSAGAGFESLDCGRLVRQAWVTGVEVR